MNITIKDVPEELHERLRETAEKSGRSLNKLILFTLDRAVSPQKTDRPSLIQRVRKRRNAMDGWMEQEFLTAAIEEGRQ